MPWPVAEVAAVPAPSIGDNEPHREHLALPELPPEVPAKAEGAEGAVLILPPVVLAVEPELSLSAAARSLGMSDRTLQRALHEAGTSFRAERRHAAIPEAKAPPAETDDKPPTGAERPPRD